jgi:pimeloyl-ACP methyl ester carboxylesterase
MPKVQAGRIELEVVRRGVGLPLLLVHGFPLEHSMWHTQIELLSSRWQVIAPDLRGFGGSQVIAGTATMEHMAGDLDTMLDALEIEEPVVFCGLSMGGYVGFQFWRKHRARLRALVLCDTRAIADTPEGAAGRLKLAETVLREGTGPLAEAMLPKLFAPATIERENEMVESQRKKIQAASREGVAAALRGMAARPSAVEYLPQISLPTLVVVGSDDAISTPDEMRGIAAAIPGSEFVVIPHSGHMTPLENPAAFDTAIERFLARVESES